MKHNYLSIYIFLLLFILYIVKYTNIIKTRIHREFIYKQYPLYRKYKVIKNLLTKNECNRIIKESINYGVKNGWTTDRHTAYPTTDNQITNKWKIYNNILYDKINVIKKHIENLFHLKKNKLKIHDLFVAKYEGNNPYRQYKLKPHKDGYEFSFIIALNDDYKGGGTKFIKNNKTIHLNTGDVLIFSGQQRHTGLPTILGTRYIVPGFLKY